MAVGGNLTNFSECKCPYVEMMKDDLSARAHLCLEEHCGVLTIEHLKCIIGKLQTKLAAMEKVCSDAGISTGLPGELVPEDSTAKTYPMVSSDVTGKGCVHHVTAAVEGTGEESSEIWEEWVELEEWVESQDIWQEWIEPGSGTGVVTSPLGGDAPKVVSHDAPHGEVQSASLVSGEEQGTCGGGGGVLGTESDEGVPPSPTNKAVVTHLPVGGARSGDQAALLKKVREVRR